MKDDGPAGETILRCLFERVFAYGCGINELCVWKKEEMGDNIGERM